ncbi:MAG: hypothetical protein HYV96_19680 [Opitutae bacterium]|nr:hypothetical protein [Opitutae bacterium]
MKRWIFIILCFSQASCARNDGNLVPIERTAIFPAAKAADLIRTVCYEPLAATDYWTPNATDIDGLEQTLAEFLDSRGANRKKDWSTFRRQIAGVKRGDERLIFIYYFRFDQGIEDDLVKRKEPRYDPAGWRSEPHLVFDGGEEFFRVLYDVKTKRFIWYECNGVA